MIVAWVLLGGVAVFSALHLVPAFAARLRASRGPVDLREALDDLWGALPADEIQLLDPATVAVAKANHQRLNHGRRRLHY